MFQPWNIYGGSDNWYFFNQVWAQLISLMSWDAIRGPIIILIAMWLAMQLWALVKSRMGV